jgi:hypothetical protein
LSTLEQNGHGLSVECGKGWPAPDAKTYEEVAARLLGLAADAKSAEARVQYALLAALYQNLAERAARLLEAGPLPRIIPAE